MPRVAQADPAVVWLRSLEGTEYAVRAGGFCWASSILVGFHPAEEQTPLQPHAKVCAADNLAGWGADFNKYGIKGEDFAFSEAESGAETEGWVCAVQSGIEEELQAALRQEAWRKLACGRGKSQENPCRTAALGKRLRRGLVSHLRRMQVEFGETLPRGTTAGMHDTQPRLGARTWQRRRTGKPWRTAHDRLALVVVHPFGMSVLLRAQPPGSLSWSPRRLQWSHVWLAGEGVEHGRRQYIYI